MRERAYICFQGQEKAGKTTLILKILESSRKIHWLVCRILETNSPELIGTWTESEETILFKEGGALKSLLYYVSNKQSGLDDPFWHSSFINYYSNAIAFEGNKTPMVVPDLYVHVMRPLKPKENLVSWKEVEMLQFDASEYLKMAYGITLPEDAHVLTEDEQKQFDQENDIETDFDEEDSSHDILEIPDELGELIIKAVEKKSIPIKKNTWTLHDEHKNIGRCGLILINIHDESERADAERTSKQIKELRTRSEFCNNLLSPREEILRVTIIIANLNNPRDPELKKALARIKRVVSKAKSE